MSERDDLIAIYARDLRDQCGVTPDKDFLTRVTAALGPSIYDADSATVAGSQPSESETIRKNFLTKKLGLPEGPELEAAIDKVIGQYGRSNRSKHRALIYYLLAKHFSKESVYG